MPRRAQRPAGAGGFPDYDDLLERYARGPAATSSGIDYYMAFSCWRLAVISEGVYARYLHGAMGEQVTSTIEMFKVGVDSSPSRRSTRSAGPVADERVPRRFIPR